MRPRWTAAIALATLASTTLSACAVESQSPGAGWPHGRTFLSTSVTENGTPRQLIAGTRIRLSFEADRIAANAGCNHMGGSAHLANGVLVVSDLATTEMGCPGGRHDQDEWFAAFLTSGPTLDLRGDELTLASTTVTIVLLDRRVADPDRPLAGTRWLVDTVIEGDVVSSGPTTGVLQIDRSGGFQASTGCDGGTVRGTAAIAGNRVTFTVTAQTPCTGASNSLDRAMRATLSGERTYEIIGPSLHLIGADGHGIAAYEDSLATPAS